MPWLKKEIFAGNVIVIKKYFSARYHNESGKSRALKQNGTSEAMRRINEQNRILNADLLVNTNFQAGDWFLTYTFERQRRPKNYGELEKIWARYLRKLRQAYRADHKEMKYVCCRETNPFHIHIVLNHMDYNLFPLWGYGAVYKKRLDGRAYHTVGSYFMKEKQRDSGIFLAEAEGKSSFSSSRNLKKPRVRVTVMHTSRWQEPKPYQHYYIDKNSFYEGFCAVTGYRYQTYRMIRLC